MEVPTWYYECDDGERVLVCMYQDYEELLFQKRMILKELKELLSKLEKVDTHLD